MCHCSWVARRFGARADLSTALMSLACFRPRLRAVVPLVAAANFAADLHLFTSLAVPLLATASFGTISGRTMVSAFVFFALLQLLGRSAADIVREDTDREMATFLMDPLVPPESGVQTLFFDFDATFVTVAPA